MARIQEPTQVSLDRTTKKKMRYLCNRRRLTYAGKPNVSALIRLLVDKDTEEQLKHDREVTTKAASVRGRRTR